MEKLIKGSLASGIETARKVNEIVEWINNNANLIAIIAEKPQNRCKKDWCVDSDLLKFETKEQAERAAEKLDAFTRLKNKGLVWQGWEEGAMDNGMGIVSFQIPEDNWETDVVRDLDLLFGGEE